MLGFKTAATCKCGSKCGFEAHMVEHTFMKCFEHMDLGTQRLNRCTGAGNPCRNKGGICHVFLTHARTADVFDFMTKLVVVE